VKFAPYNKSYIMKNQFIKLEKIDTDVINIVSINNAGESEIEDEELMDFDFDYDPNEMYYALLNED
jgi:hypothetical protein